MQSSRMLKRKLFCGQRFLWTRTWKKVFHDQPSILHFGKPGEGEVLSQGMFFTVEPMINIGDYKVKILSDGWTAVTSDKSLSAQFEHSIGVTHNGYEIFTQFTKKIYIPTIYRKMIPRYSRKEISAIWEPKK